MNCPSCGADLEEVNRFSHLVVCPYCATSIILDEKAARLSGKMALLPASTSPLFVGATGQFEGQPFQVLGRVRYGYANGYWDEWYVVLSDDTMVWISEDEGNYTLERLADNVQTSVEYATVQPGGHLNLGGEPFHVDEKDVAVCEGGEGQLPFVIVLGEKTPYLDLSTDKAFATVQWSSDGQCRIFRGRRLQFTELELDQTAEEAGRGSDRLAVETPGDDLRRERVVRREDRSKTIQCSHCGADLGLPEDGAEVLTCSHCGGMVDLSLRPITCAQCSASITVHGKKAKSAVCPHCGWLLDLSGNEPSALGSLKRYPRPNLPIQLGQKGTLRGVAYEVVGHIRYREKEAGASYITDEFLLYNPAKGYDWLTLYQGHFGLSKELATRPKKLDPRTAWVGKEFSFNQRTWKVYERPEQPATVSFVDGELPWVARIGDQIHYMDATSPPYLLTAEWTGSEMEWYQSEHLPRPEVAHAFGIPESKLPRRSGVAPHQPYPAGRFRRESALLMAAFAVVNLLLAILLLLIPGRQIASFTIQPGQYAAETLTPAFTVTRSNTVCQAKFNAPCDNSWLYLDVALVNAKDEALLDFSAEMTYYHGYDDEYWTEGSKSDEAVFRVAEAGEYRFLLLGQAGKGETAGDVRAEGVPVVITVYEGVVLARYAFWLCLAAAAWAGLEALRRRLFECNRWKDAGDKKDDKDD